MKRAVLPIILAIALALLALFGNSEAANAGGVFLAGFLGLGLGFVINTIIFSKKKPEKSETK
jgi:FtsH-binding integral membrane protein